jgi:CheY-like chemotaxis protein
VLAHKQNRRVLVGQHILLVVEDEKTIRYQIQEMLRIEKVFEAVGIEEAL